MSKAIILGGGGGAPRNSVKVSEYAGEDIPANYFVSKREGSNPSYQVYHFKNYNEYIKATIPIKDDEYICVLTQQTAENIVYMKGLTEVSSVQATHGSVLSQKGLSIVHLKNQKKVLYLFRDDSYKAHYAVIVTYDSQGNLSLDKIQSNINAEDSIVYYREFVSGDYSNEYLYAITYSTSNDKSYLERWKLSSDNNLVFENSKIIANTCLLNTSNTLYTPIFLEEINCIYHLTSDNKLGQISTDTFEYKTNANFSEKRYYALTGIACYKGTYLLDTKRKVIWVTSELYSTYNVDLGYINPSNFEYYDVMSRVASGGLCPMAFDLFDDSKRHIYACTGTKVLKIDIESKEIVLTKDLSLNSDYRRGLATYKKGALEFYTWSSNNTYTLYYNKYNPGVISLPSANDPIYGISQMNIKAYEQGTVYALSDTQTVSVYGIRQDLADTIVDDGITEVKNAVLDGKEQN